MEIAPMTKRDKILLYVVLMLAFVVLFVRFLLIPGIENHQQADADLREAQDAQTSMQDTIMLAGTYAAEKNNNWGELQTANASYYSLLSSDELDTLVTSLELNHNLQPDSLTIGEPVTQSLTYYTASENAGQSAAPSAAASAFAGDDDSDDDSITADTAGTTAQGNAEQPARQGVGGAVPPSAAQRQHAAQKLHQQVPRRNVRTAVAAPPAQE